MRAPGGVLVLAALVLALGGCGSGSGATTTTTPSSAAPPAPRGASPALIALGRQFPVPQPSPGAVGSAGAIKAGEAACGGQRPSQVKARFIAAAGSHLQPQQLKMIARLASYEKHASTDPSFIAGQLGADVYAATLPAAVAQFGYQGCVYGLALGLERRIGAG